MYTAGFVLAGGASSRMGRNKAFLTLGDRTFIETVAFAVSEAAGNVTIVGPPEIYRHLGFPVIPDRTTGAGPLAGIETALSHSPADWNLLVACDMPRVTPDLLRRILAEAERHPDAGCILPDRGGGFVEPLCAAYHKRVLPAVSRSLAARILKITDAMAGQPIHYLHITDDWGFQNINTPDEWRMAGEPG